MLVPLRLLWLRRWLSAVLGGAGLLGLRLAAGLGRLLLLLLRLALAVLLQLLRRQEYLHLLPVRARLHAVGLALRGEVHLRATTAAAATAAASTLARGASGRAVLGGASRGGVTVVGALVALVVTAVVVRLGGRRGTGGHGRGRRVAGLGVVGILAHGAPRVTALEGGDHRGPPGASGEQVLGQEAGRGACEKAETAGS